LSANYQPKFAFAFEYLTRNWPAALHSLVLELAAKRLSHRSLPKLMEQRAQVFWHLQGQKDRIEPLSSALGY